MFILNFARESIGTHVTILENFFMDIRLSINPLLLFTVFDGILGCLLIDTITKIYVLNKDETHEYERNKSTRPRFIANCAMINPWLG